MVLNLDRHKRTAGKIIFPHSLASKPNRSAKISLTFNGLPVIAESFHVFNVANLDDVEAANSTNRSLNCNVDLMSRLKVKRESAVHSTRPLFEIATRYK